MRQYLDLLRKTLEEGVDRGDRTATGTRSIFGHQARYNLAEGFPLLTTKKLHIRSIVHELLWMIKGQTNVEYLQNNRVTIWDEWVNDEGELGPVYGKQWRSWEAFDPIPGSEPQTYLPRAIDQLQETIDRIQTDPNSRRHVVTAWNPADVPKMALPACHMQFQFYVANGKLSCQMYQRSADLFLGVPFNIASYALLTHMVAHVTGLAPGEFIHTLGDAHIYHNHFEQVEKQLAREPGPLPTLEIVREGITNINDFRYEDFKIVGYEAHSRIPAQVAV